MSAPANSSWGMSRIGTVLVAWSLVREAADSHRPMQADAHPATTATPTTASAPSCTGWRISVTIASSAVCRITSGRTVTTRATSWAVVDTPSAASRAMIARSVTSSRQAEIVPSQIDAVSSMNASSTL